MWKRWRIRILLFLAVLGPGFITANVDNDSGGILTLTNTNNSFSGGTSIGGGILNINSDRALGAVPGTSAWMGGLEVALSRQLQRGVV